MAPDPRRGRGFCRVEKFCAVPAEPLHVVTGAFGFTGRFITRLLLSMGVRVKTLTRAPARPNPFGGRVSAAAYNFENPDALTKSLEGGAVLYNTYWVRFARARTTFETAVANTRTLLRACEAAGVPRIVHVSVTNASEDSPFPYFRGKAIVEETIKTSSLSYAILRPPVIFGPGDILVNNIAWFLRHFPIFPIMGDGLYRLQCLSVEDLAELAIAFASRQDRQVVDVVGPETFSFDEFVRVIADEIDSRAKIVHMSPRFVHGFLGIAGAVLRDVVLTQDEIAALMSGLLVTQSPPRGRIRFRDWLGQAAGTLGRTYASELARHYR